MGYALFTARKLMLQDRLNRMNYQMLNLQQQRNDLVDQESNIQIMQSFRNTAQSFALSQEQEDGYNAILEQYDVNNSENDSVIAAETKKLENSIQKKQLANQVQSQIDNAQLKSIQTVENQIDLQIQKLETQTQEASKELEKVEETEKTAIEKSVPQYAGA